MRGKKIQKNMQPERVRLKEGKLLKGGNCAKREDYDQKRRKD